MHKFISVFALVAMAALGACAGDGDYDGREETTGERAGELRCVQTPTGTFCHAAEPWPVAGPALTCSPHCADPWPTPPAAGPDSPEGLAYCRAYPGAPYCAES